MEAVEGSSSRMKAAKRAFGMALVAVDLWRRLPSKQRRQLVSLARKHGPGLARRAVKNRR